jgi:hypothetical protein
MLLQYKREDRGGAVAGEGGEYRKGNKATKRRMAPNVKMKGNGRSLVIGPESSSLLVSSRAKKSTSKVRGNLAATTAAPPRNCGRQKKCDRLMEVCEWITGMSGNCWRGVWEGEGQGGSRKRTWGGRRMSREAVTALAQRTDTDDWLQTVTLWSKVRALLSMSWVMGGRGGVRLGGWCCGLRLLRDGRLRWHLQSNNRKVEPREGERVASNAGKSITHGEVRVHGFAGSYKTENSHQLGHRIGGLLTGDKVSARRGYVRWRNKYTDHHLRGVTAHAHKT